MSSYERTAVQAVIGQKLDGQLQNLLSEHERPIQQKLFALKQLCSKADKLSPDLVGETVTPIPQDGSSEYLFACASQDIADKAELHSFTRKSLRAAQLRHGYVSSKERNSTIQSVLVLLIAIFGEALINAAFFSNAHMVAGPSAALITSFLISMTNVVVCACAGFFIGRYRDYGLNALDGEDKYFRRKRFVAKVQFVGFVTLMGFFHLTVGLVRAQESIQTVSHSLPSYLHMLETPEAIFLILIGACMSVIAFHKGVNSFDCPYPEIGRLQRAEDTAKQDVQDAFDFYQEEITANFEDAEKTIHALIADKKKAVQRYNKAVSACHEARQKLERSVRDGETQCRGKLAELITSYRCISGEEESVPVEMLNRMICFEKYLDVEMPAFHSTPEISAFKAELMIEKNQAVNRLASVFNDVLNATGGKKS